MIAIIFMMRTKYDCTLGSKSDFIWLQSYLIPIRKDCNHIKSISDQDYTNIRSPYLVPFKAKIAIIFGLHHKNYCNPQVVKSYKLIGIDWSCLQHVKSPTDLKNSFFQKIFKKISKIKFCNFCMKLRLI